MKKIGLIVLVLVLIFSLVGCSGEIVSIHCDTEGCKNMVEVEVKEGKTVDESWVVYCEECADKVLDDK